MATTPKKTPGRKAQPSSKFPDVTLPRSVQTKQQTTTAASGEAGDNIQRPIRQLWNTSIQALRDSGQTVSALRQLMTKEGTSSSALFALVQVAFSTYQVKAYNTQTGVFDPAGTLLAQQVMAKMNTLYDYTEGFADKPSIDSTLMQMLREVAMTDAVCAELVLDKNYVPHRFQLFPYESVTWQKDGLGGRLPVQKSAEGEDIILDFATVAIAEGPKDADSAYGRSMFEAALTMAFYYGEFIEDMRRVLKKAGHSRVKAQLVAEAVVGIAPADIKKDPAKLKAWMEDHRRDVERILSAVDPEAALVYYDHVDITVDRAQGDKSDYTELVTAISGMLATALKSSPSILGLRLQGSQSLSNTESLIFLKTARYLQIPVETVMSRLVTLAVRLSGVDVYVEFKFDPINLRPDDELEAFRSMRIDNVLTLLSLGFYTDDEAAAKLGTGPRAAGAPPLSGTMFHQKAVSPDASKVTPNDDPMGKSMQSDQPQAKRGGQKAS